MSEAQATAAEVLHSERSLTIGGRSVTINELSFRQELDLGPVIAGLMAELDGVVGDGSDLTGLFDTLYRYPDVLLTMLEMSTEQDRDWLDGLSGPDGAELVMAFWGVNAGFFSRRLLARRMLAKVGKR